MDIFPFRDHKESTIRGTIFEKLYMIEYQNGDLKELEETNKQKDILDLLNSVSWW
jgi:hypothetical protein